MKDFTNDELRNKKLFKFILDISEKEIHNMGFQYFDQNLHYNSFLELINRILNEYYQISVNKISVIKFKENFEEYKNSSIIGDITINSNKDGNIQSRKIVRYHGEFVYYSILNHWLFSRVFNDEIENENKVYTRVRDILGSNYAELNLNPSNDLIIRPFEGVVTSEFPEKSDVGDYVQLFLDHIGKVEIEEKINNDLILDVEELSTKGRKLMLMNEIGLIDYIINKYLDKGEVNINHLSNIIHCFTGLGLTTIQSVLNPIYNMGNNQKNNPYNRQKNIDVVSAKIAELHLKAN